MNPLTQVKNIQKINEREAALGLSDNASWHVKYKDSAYVFVGGVPFDLTEGDLLAVFSQYGEVVDVNLVRDKGTGKSKGFAFLAYEDQLSTNLAVDNLNGAQLLGRIIKVDHVANYKKKQEEDEETERKRREERGVCRAFQKGECNRGDGCKFSHDEQRAANTGWGAEEDRRQSWSHDKFEDSRMDRRSGQSSRPPQSDYQGKAKVRDEGPSSFKARKGDMERHYERKDLSSRDHHKIDMEHRSKQKEKEISYKEDLDSSRTERRSRRYDDSTNSREDTERKSRRHNDLPISKEYDDRRDVKKTKRYESESYHDEKRDGMEREKRGGFRRDGRDEDDRSGRSSRY